MEPRRKARLFFAFIDLRKDDGFFSHLKTEELFLIFQKPDETLQEEQEKPYKAKESLTLPA
ncbi:MAG: hypothetical protein LUG99_12940 [Lachnospiraceae bacterium]|nr:hypothetical protein [Lachnospiraceae bacterium]